MLGHAERAWRLAAVTTAVIVALDQITKQAAIASIARGESENVFFGLDITNIRNTGVAFGALKGAGLLVLALTLLGLGALLFYFQMEPTRPMLVTPVGMVDG